MSTDFSLFLHPTDVYEINNIINSFKNKKSTDIYGFTTITIKHISDIICQPLEHVFNLCLAKGTFPTALKIAKVIPIHKKGNKDEPGNFRPIALLPIISKIFETIIKVRMITYFERNKLLSEQQFGFRQGKSTTCAVADAVEFLLASFEEGKFVNATFCDLSKAFDSVSHDILLNKLNFYGVRGVALDLIGSFLTDRFQLVELNKAQSSLLANQYSVPQGSVLSPLLFLIYINDLPVNIKNSKCILFADDTTLLSSSYNKDEAIMKSGEALSNAEQWFCANRLKLNREKTHNMVLHYRINCDNIVNDIRFLGLHIDSSLNWKCHCQSVLNKMSCSMYALRKITPVVPFQTAKVAYHALVHSHLSYGILLWGASPDAIKVFRAQKKSLRIICRLRTNMPCKEVFIRHTILTLPCIFIYYTLIYVKTNMNTFNIVNKTLHRETRFGKHLETPKIRLQVARHSPRFWGPKFFNHLPDRIKVLNLAKFKTAVKSILLEKAYYTMEEFMRDCVV